MFCPKCGKELKQGAAFCPYCGWKLEENINGDGQRKDVLQKEKEGSTILVLDTGNPGNSLSGGSRNKKLLILALAGVVVLILAVVLLNSNRKITISPMDYVSVNVDGWNSEGTASCYFDYMAMVNDLTAQKKMTDEQVEDAAAILSAQSSSFSISKSSGISNGDKITVESTLDENLLKAYGVKLENDSTTIKAEGLMDIQDVKLGNYIIMNYEGYNGAGYATASYDYEKLWNDLMNLAQAAAPDKDQVDIENDISFFMNQIYSSADKTESLSNGDKVTASITSETTRLDDYGIRLVEGSETMTVENLAEPEEIDLTEAVHVTFSGICPNVKVEISVDEVPYYYSTSLSSLAYTTETVQASNGDTYGVTVDYDESELLSQGYVVTNNYKEYEISGLNDYRLNFDGAGDENLQNVVDDFTDNAVICALGEESGILSDTGDQNGNIVWTNTETEFCLAEDLFITDEYSSGNELILVYVLKLPVRFSDQTLSEKDVYYAVSLYNVEQTPSETLEYSNWDQRILYNEEALQTYIQDESAYMGENTSVSVYENENQETSLLDLEKLANPTAEPLAASEGSYGGTYETGVSNAACRISYEGHVYLRFDQNLSWDEAEEFCESLTGEDGEGFHLATVTSAREMQIIKALLTDAPYSTYFLGGTDKDFEGDWNWVTGESFDWYSWSDGQPDNDDDNEDGCENYLETGSKWNYQFNDINRNYTDSGFIAEWESAENSETQEQVYLSDLAPASSYNTGLTEQLQDPYGSYHFYSTYLYGDTSSVSYNLNGGYSRLETNLSTWTDTASGAKFNFAVWGDGKLLYSNYNYRKTDAPVFLSLDLTGVQTLKMEVSNSGECDNSYLFLNECKLTAAETQAETTIKKDELQDLWLIASNNYESYEGKGMVTDPVGYFRRDYYTFDGPSGGYGAWSLDGAYTDMEAYVMAGTGSYSEDTAIILTIKADGEIILEEQLTIFDGVVPVSLDLNGVERLEISAAKKENGGEGRLYLMDTLFSNKAMTESTDDMQEETFTFPEVDQESIARAAAWIEYRDAEKSRRYYLFEESMSWEEAEAFCEEAGGHLATPTTWGENNALRALVGNGTGNEYWMGAKRTESGSWAWCCGPLNGTVWRLEDGTESGIYTNWSGGQPDYYEEAEYILTMYYDGTWNDNRDTSLGFIMEVDAQNENSYDEIAYWQDPDTDNGYISVYDGNSYYPYGIKLNASDWQSIYYESLPFTVDEQSVRPQTLKGILMVDSNASAYADISVEIFGDGKLLYEKTGLTSASSAIPFEVDISGVQNLVVASGNEGSTDNGYVYFGYLAFCGEAGDSQTISHRLTDMVQIDAQNVETWRNSMHRDAYGIPNDGYVGLNGYEDGYCVYNLNSEMTTFSGKITAGRNATDYGARTSLRIYDGDDNLLYELSDFAVEDGPVDFSIDIIGVSVLRIESSGTDDAYGSWIYITEDNLS